MFLLRQPVAHVLDEYAEVVSDGADAFLEDLAKSSVDDELGEDVRDLQQEVVILGPNGVVAVDVLQLTVAVLLDIESLILNFPSLSSSLVGQFVDGLGTDR